MQRNYAEMELSQNLKKIDTLVENFLSKNEPILQSESEVLTIYITNLLQFLMEIGEIDENFKTQAHVQSSYRYALKSKLTHKNVHIFMIGQ